VNEVEHVHLANHLLGIVTEDTLESGVGVAQGAIEVDDLHDLRGVLQDRAQPPIVFPCIPLAWDAVFGWLCGSVESTPAVFPTTY
jgi:hypothetical protein